MAKHILLKNRQLALENENRKFLYDLSYAADGKEKPLIIFLHGFKGFKDWGNFDLMMEYFTQLNYAFIKMNFSHNGTTLDSPLEFNDLDRFGRNNFIIELEDVQAMIDRLFKDEIIPSREWDKRKLLLIGHSRGGSIAMLKGSEDKRVLAVVSLAGVADLKKFLNDKDIALWRKGETVFIDNARTGQKMPLYPQFLESYVANKSRLDVVAAASKLNHLLIVHGSADSTVSVDNAFALKNSNPSAELKVIENADHTFGGKHPYIEKVLPLNFKIVCDLIADYFQNIEFKN
ncbi:MAG: prolyl oligopeptidase family serine peptidase [Sporocytophaga sp.]|uniref:alpha/beta hydrolase family protein n=1 Tax=Sporocytophaga sp. TaxID=2231183 RepID=UPI001B2CE265|nr:prolyl oligopeptidase family serine peptidase [Sporocytophaga sp.]MBO9700947.1 prolyl oligopeptidase family serine peptidase [Sporocytophaga sp.]